MSGDAAHGKEVVGEIVRAASGERLVRDSPREDAAHVGIEYGDSLAKRERPDRVRRVLPHPR